MTKSKTLLAALLITVASFQAAPPARAIGTCLAITIGLVVSAVVGGIVEIAQATSNHKEEVRIALKDDAKAFLLNPAGSPSALLSSTINQVREAYAKNPNKDVSEDLSDAAIATGILQNI